MRNLWSNTNDQTPTDGMSQVKVQRETREECKKSNTLDAAPRPKLILIKTKLFNLKENPI